MNSYLNDRKAIDRLKREYNQHKNLIIGYDFDGTIYDYHTEGLEIEPVIELLKRCTALGFTMCMYTLTPIDAPLREKAKMAHAMGLGIGVDYINDSPVFVAQLSRSNDKPFFNILLDDRAGLQSAYHVLLTTLNELGL